MLLAMTAWHLPRDRRILSCALESGTAASWVALDLRLGLNPPFQMERLTYQRPIVAYHGCGRSLAEQVLLGKAELKMSENDYDWLGKSIYFWEHGPRRAYDWARWRAEHPGKSVERRIKTPYVLGAHIQLGACFDLLDTSHSGLLAKMFPVYTESCAKRRVPIPENKSTPGSNAFDLVLRYRDCAVINWCIEIIEAEEDVRFDTVRCIFSEGEPVFEGSKIMEKSHIQVAVRNPMAIIGVFKPNLDFLPG
jgi:hypothetical protein